MMDQTHFLLRQVTPTRASLSTSVHSEVPVYGLCQLKYPTVRYLRAHQGRSGWRGYDDAILGVVDYAERGTWVGINFPQFAVSSFGIPSCGSPLNECKAKEALVEA